MQNYVNHSGGIETGSTTELSIVAQDLVSSKFASWNTFAHLPVVADTYDTLTVSFTTPRNLSVHTSVHTYLIINQDKGKELRYPKVAPTFNMNTTLFGTGFDASDSATGTYFKQSNGHPWALKIPREFVYLPEHKSITAGYLNFASWASSGGSSNANWYDHTIPTNVDTTKLMLP